MKKSLWIAGLSVLISSSAFAQGTTLLAAADSSSGAYSKMLGEIKKVCNGPDLNIQEIKNTGGAVGNLSALVNNEASIAFLHSDVIYSAAAADPDLKRLVTLIALYPEEVHIVALRNSGVKRGGFHGVGGTAFEFQTLADLAGYKLAAAGGGIVTSKLLQGMAEAKFALIQKDSGAEVMAALDSGEVQAALFVGAAPLPNIIKLDANRYKLLPIPESISNRVTSIYHTATLNYPNLRSGSIRTIAPDAIILTRQYKSPHMVAPQRQFRKCFFENLDDLKETPGTHKKWQQVNASNRGSWTWYEIPGEEEAPSPPAITPKSSKKLTKRVVEQ